MLPALGPGQRVRHTCAMRVYIPATASDLSDPRGVTPRLAHAVTPALAQALPDEDDDGLAFVAMLAAADDAVALLRGRPDDVPRRIVVVAETDAVVVPERQRPWREGDDELPSRVEVTEPVPWAVVEALHADAAEAQRDVAAAVADKSGADETSGQEAGGEATLEAAAEHDLLWFDATERAVLAEELGVTTPGREGS